MSKREKRPKKKERLAAVRAALATLPKLSETMLQFAKPLLDLAPDPPSLDMLRHILAVATITWNLPLYEKHKHPRAPSMRAMFGELLAVTPPEIVGVVSAMLASRLTTYGGDPRVGALKAVEDAPGHARIEAMVTTMDWMRDT